MPDSPSPEVSRSELAGVLLAGAILLLVVHGLGRFYFTPLLPYLVQDGQLDTGEGAAVATWNYLGYLMGALLAVRWHRIGHIRLLLPLSLAIHLVTTLAQTQVASPDLLSLLRWLNGVGNGVVFVQAPALILEWLVLRGRAGASGLVYLGVGAGLLLSSALVALTPSWLTGAERWWPAALLSLPLSWWACRRILRLAREAGNAGSSQQSPAGSRRLVDRASLALFLAYAGAGLGYILPMTFLPLLAHTQLSPGAWLVDGSWLVVALATIPSVWLWNHVGTRLGDRPALCLNYLIQLLGVLAAVLLPPSLGLLLCAALVGGTFLGTVLLTQRLGRALHPHQGPRLSAALIALYGLAQMAGPWLAKQWIGAGGTLASAFWIGALALAWGLVFVALVPRPESWYGRH